MADSERPEERAWEMMGALGSCMLVSKRGGALHGRPMAAIVRPEEGRVYFFTDRDTAKTEEIGGDADVWLGFSDAESKHVSVNGRAEIVDDPALARRLWGLGAQAYWPKGPDDEKLVVIEVSPRSAEYWDGSIAPVAAVKMAAAIATGTTPDMGDNRKTAM